jgi:hypothetical protein
MTAETNSLGVVDTTKLVNSILHGSSESLKDFRQTRKSGLSEMWWPSVKPEASFLSPMCLRDWKTGESEARTDPKNSAQG